MTEKITVNVVTKTGKLDTHNETRIRRIFNKFDVKITLITGTIKPVVFEPGGLTKFAGNIGPSEKMVVFNGEHDEDEILEVKTTYGLVVFERPTVTRVHHITKVRTKERILAFAGN